ncbi:hypothetical protein [Massilibacteroides sp.]|uniref:hypothetical protein n=1 Tax=Massilibacteroides sp. TaxID=2034766 RepID=UPI00261EF12E|nr:hypothetical protein [Massilibacteroides sp.]MDD4516755.1 hypothetical protein [Massilibacteroides sp.]
MPTPTPTKTNDNYLNIPQMQCILADPKELYANMGRGLGKSTEIIAHLTANRVYDMPRAGFLIMGRTYKQILTKTLPATVDGWNKRGFVEGVHYVIGEKPPWPVKAYGAPVKDYHHFISFYTGTGFHLGSQDRAGLVNSLTVWGIFGDESKLLLEDRFKEDAIPTLRGNKELFKDNPHNRCIVLTSSMPPLPEGQWLYDMEKRMDESKIEAIINLAWFVEELKLKYSEAGEYFKPRIAKKIKSYSKKLNEWRQGSVMYAEASSLANIHILRPDYILQQKDILKGKFRTEILNLRPTRGESLFYANLLHRHFYTDFNYPYLDRFNYKNIKEHDNCEGDNDLVKNHPLIIGMDFGANLNCIVTTQRLESIQEIRFLKNHWVKPPLIIDHVCQEWCDYYSTHANRDLTFYYDSTGNNRQPNTNLTFAQQATRVFEKNGWNVSCQTIGGSNPQHDKKYLLWNLMLLETNRALYKVRINEANAADLKYSMEFAPAKEDSNGKIQKDKSSERKKTIPAEEATHLSDAADTIVFGEFRSALDSIGDLYYDVIIR